MIDQVALARFAGDEEEDVREKQAREGAEWASEQIKTGEAEGNANFVEVSDDWMKRREELMRKKEQDAKGE